MRRFYFLKMNSEVRMIDLRTILTAYAGSIGGSIVGMCLSIYTLINIEHLFMVLMSSVVGGSASLIIREMGPDVIKWLRRKLKKRK